MIKKLIKILIILPIVGILIIITLFLGFYWLDRQIFTPRFFDTKEEIAWAENISSREVHFYNEPWANFGTITISEENSYYVSPMKRHQLYLKPYKNSKTAIEGFYITNIKTGKVVLDSNHWVIHPSEVKWLFNEKYIVYPHVENDLIGVKVEYVYVGSLKTGEIARLTKTKSVESAQAKNK